MVYAYSAYRGEKPIMGTLAAFKLNATFSQVLNNKPLETRISVQPNFEIYIDAPVYPIATLKALAPLTKVIKEDRQIILKLEKQLTRDEELKMIDSKTLFPSSKQHKNG